MCSVQPITMRLYAGGRRDLPSQFRGGGGGGGGVRGYRLPKHCNIAHRCAIKWSETSNGASQALEQDGRAPVWRVWLQARRRWRKPQGCHTRWQEVVVLLKYCLHPPRGN
jgi:hypothetical protein